MTTHTFDLISDLNVEPNENFSWVNQATSPLCIVAGNVSQDPATVQTVLTELGRNYYSVFYIDGLLEHTSRLEDIDSSYEELSQLLEPIPDVVYLQNRVVIAGGIALVGTNGWFTFDFDPNIDYYDSREWSKEYLNCSDAALDAIQTSALNDHNYMRHSIARLQKMPEVKHIVVVTSTVPDAKLVKHDPTVAGSYKFNLLGNSYLQNAALKEDTEKKIQTWCFGSHSGVAHSESNRLAYKNNAKRARQYAYYPTRISVSVNP